MTTPSDTDTSGLLLALGLLLREPVTDANRMHFAKRCLEQANKLSPGLADEYLAEMEASSG